MTTDRTNDPTYYATLRTFADAGLFRQYLANRHGGLLTYGGDGRSYFRALRLCRSLAKMTGQTQEQVVEQVKLDYAQADAQGGN